MGENMEYLIEEPLEVLLPRPTICIEANGVIGTSQFKRRLMKTPNALLGVLVRIVDTKVGFILATKQALILLLMSTN
jgi:hypothetical protein